MTEWEECKLGELCEQNAMNTDDIRWKQRYAHFSRALTLLREVVDESDIEKLKPLEQEGTIQRFASLRGKRSKII